MKKLKRVICLILCMFFLVCISVPIGTHYVTRKMIKTIEAQNYEAFQDTLQYCIDVDGLPYFRASCSVYCYPGTNSYVVIEDSSGSLVQASQFGDAGWIPDSSIVWDP